MEFDDIYELLESVRLYRLRTNETLVCTNSVTGVVIGYATADSGFPSVEWTIPLARAKDSALARGTKEARRIRELIGSYMGRRQLLEELRQGTLEYGIARVPAPVPEHVPFVDEGPVQCLIPGL
jgi:hypothetical protein